MPVRRAALAKLAWLLLLIQAQALAQSESPADVLLEGQWLEVRGSTTAPGVFVAQRVDLVQPGRYQVLIGTVSNFEDDGHFTLLGQRVEIQEKTRFGRLDANVLNGARVKVEGYYRKAGNFSARAIRPRGDGRERIMGRIENIRRQGAGLALDIMNFTVEIPPRIMVRHELALSDYRKSASEAVVISERNKDEEDLFGKGIWIGDTVLMSGQAQTRGIMEDEFDLNERRARNRDELLGTFRARFVYQPGPAFFAVAELRYRQLLRDDEKDGRSNDRSTGFGETYAYWIDPFGYGLDLQAGRVDFDEAREWLYDQNLDTVRAIWTGNYVRAELSYSETLSDGSKVDEAAANSMLYVSNGDDARHLAAYIIHRNFDLPIAIRRTHYGVRAFGEWLPKQESWLEISLMDGKTGSIDTRGWGLDIGTTWRFHDRFALTAGYAVGQGDDADSATDHSFRQTGLNDNNAKFAGVTSFRYYGELADPELANLEIMTAGLGWLPKRGISLDLVWHSYAQNELSTRLVDTNIGRRPNGRSKDIGSELDLVFGWRTSYRLDIELVAAWFKPGRAFDGADDAFLGKLQLRYRF